MWHTANMTGGFVRHSGGLQEAAVLCPAAITSMVALGHRCFLYVQVQRWTLQT